MTIKTSRDILLQTPHLQQAADFYRDQLGMRVFLNTPDLIGLDAGTFNLFLDCAPALGPVFEFLVEDFAATRRRLLDEGCTLIVEDATIPRCYLRDPFGLIFNLAADPNAVPAGEEEEIRGNEPPPHY
jgi:catechol 2,3-dioxygenase-like lactoylglutathione lyase family enzyme